MGKFDPESKKEDKYIRSSYALARERAGQLKGRNLRGLGDEPFLGQGSAATLSDNAPLRAESKLRHLYAKLRSFSVD